MTALATEELKELMEAYPLDSGLNGRIIHRLASTLLAEREAMDVLQAEREWCFDMDKAPKNERLEVFIECDEFGPIERVEIRTLRTGNWMGFSGFHWANDHGGIRKNDASYSAWRKLSPPKTPEGEA